jgi:hypothetical protein
VRASLSSGQLKPQTSAFKSHWSTPVVFVVSIMRRIAVMEHTLSLLCLPPKRDQTPKDALSTGQPFYNHFEPSFVHHSHKFVIGDRDLKLLPPTMPVASFPIIGFLDSLHRAGEADDVERIPNVFQPHELVAPFPAPVPGLSPQMLESLWSELDRAEEIGAVELMGDRVNCMRFEQNVCKVLV